MVRWAAQTSRVRVLARSRPSPPLYSHFNWPSGFWPCVKSCLVGGSDKYIHSEDIKYHDTGNGWTFISVSAWKNYVNAMRRGSGMLRGTRALKSIKCIEKIKPRMMVATFNGNPSCLLVNSARCNGYCLIKWTWLSKFKLWTKVFAFHIVRIPLGEKHDSTSSYPPCCCN